MSLSIVAVLLVAALASLALERLRHPRGPLPGAPGLHLLIMTVLFLTAYALTRRLYFSLLAALCAQLVIIIVNNAKYRFLREVLVFADFALYSQALRFPRLYLPFVGLVPAIGGALAVGGSIAVALLFEPASALLSASPWLDRLGAVIATIVALFLLIRLGRGYTVTLQPNRDSERLGLLPALAVYGAQSRPTPHLAPQTLPTLKRRPNLIAIQSESFFDARRLDGSIRRDVLERFDRLCRESLAFGRLEVPAWGAYTMRSEFAFLTGRHNGNLGFGRFDPLRYFQGRLADCGILSIAACLKQQGYRCICIHPYPAEFFARHRIYPELGFDAFIDIASFADTDRFGPYTSDDAVCSRIIAELEHSEQPLFLFAITMENHGPLHLERIEPVERGDYFSQPTGQNDDNLAIYLRHLKNADRMLARLTDHLAVRDPDAILTWYGDHVPGMPDIYQSRDYRDGRTDYLIWSASTAGVDTRPCDRSVDELPQLMLESANRIREPVS